MTHAAIFVAGAAYAACLWLIAVRIARQRALALGNFPAPLIAACGAAAVAVQAFLPAHYALAAGTSLIGAVICGLVDARTGFIFDALSLAMTATACAALCAGHRLADGALGALVVGAALAALYFVTGRRGIGLGDVKLGSILALGYGLAAGIVALAGAFVLGAVYAGALIGTGRARRTDALRFGPFIAGGAVLALGADVLGWRW